MCLADPRELRTSRSWPFCNVAVHRARAGTSAVAQGVGGAKRTRGRRWRRRPSDGHHCCLCVRATCGSQGSDRSEESTGPQHDTHRPAARERRERLRVLRRLTAALRARQVVLRDNVLMYFNFQRTSPLPRQARCAPVSNSVDRWYGTRGCSSRPAQATGRLGRGLGQARRP